MANERPNPWFSLIPSKTAKPHTKQRVQRRPSTLDWVFGSEEKPVDMHTDRSPFQRTPPTPPEPEARRAVHIPSTGSSSGGANPPVIELLRNDVGARRVIATRLAIDEALDRWWTDGTLPALALLRDGLLLLEAGHTLDETQCSFLLRIALRRQRGMITALRYQHDPDRTAFLIKEALLDLRHPLPPKFLTQLQQEDEQSEVWMDYLVHDLAYEAGVAPGKRRQLAVNALSQARQGVHQWSGSAATSLTGLLPELLPLSYRWSLRWLLWAICLLSFVIGYGAFHRTVYAQTVRIPAGSYTISDPLGEGRMRTVVLPAFRIDLTEVTNGAYQRCYASGGCASPSSEASATRVDYFTNPAYAEFPVIHVSWDNAHAYCAWLGKRLPTAEEWEVAAGIAPLTERYFRYPWGDRFEPNFVNGGNALTLDTRAVGSFHPVGNSSFGLRDVAGNVAEWTASPAADLFDGFVVKGGSYRDDAEWLRLDVQQELVRTTGAPWLGFRCTSE